MEKSEGHKAEQDQKKEEEEPEWDFKPAGPLNPEQEKSLGEFLAKVSRACEGDKSVPTFVGTQVNEWLEELSKAPKQD